MSLTASEPPRLEIQGLTVILRGRPVVESLSLTAPPKALTLLTGPNGAGKSTLLRAVAGLLAPTAGRIFLDGEPIEGLPVWERVAKGLVLVPEGMEVFPDLSVEENLEVGAYVYRQDLARRLEEVYHLFPDLAERRHLPAGVLSGGQQRMVTLGRGLMSGARVLLFDEPFLGLSPRFVKLFRQVFRTLLGQGLTLMVASQLETHLLLPAAKAAYFLDQGRVVKAGSGPELAADPELAEFFHTVPA